ncbi:P pilus assembly protein, chaperone PapD [Oceanococcus atlanticus]|uniref:P pilus assembly protein, chaperone PapD n=1 Tax=Oceanococcus atlanticus TaxID=1317117 RepID=A0A1Y1SGX9_9GAMM|nr:fimbria/pilus periplasmic chaperone [Oceanococcus atlanticus]ORE88915.1 P pilus assembly protein, chaperone PapD [Oceanococcus atlanticus]
MILRAPLAVGAALLFSLLLAPTGALALGLQVSPIKLHFAPGVRVQELRLSNAGDAPVVVEIKVLRWSQRDNQELLVASRDVLVTPPISEIAAGQRRSVRVGIRQRDDTACETSYRVEIMEVPSQHRTPAAPVNFLTRMLLPAFVESRHGCQGQLQVQGNTNELVLHNSGDAHLQLHQATLVDGEQRWPISLPKVGYLLGGSQYRWPLPAGVNPAAARLIIKDHAGEQRQPLTLAP